MNKADQPLHSLGYLVREYGLDHALREYYPRLVASDPVLRVGLDQLQAATFMLEARVKHLEGVMGDDDQD